MKDFQSIADRIAGLWINKNLASEPDWYAVRDFCDFQTDSDLDCEPLDILTDMTMKRIMRGRIAKATGEAQ
jgi:hypothetical protein